MGTKFNKHLSVNGQNVIYLSEIFSLNRFGLVIMPPPRVSGEVYCFPRRQLIFSIGRSIMHHSKCLCEYIPKSIPAVCLYHDLQTNIFFFFLIIGRKQKNIQTNANGET